MTMVLDQSHSAYGCWLKNSIRRVARSNMVSVNMTCIDELIGELLVAD